MPRYSKPSKSIEGLAAKTRWAQTRALVPIDVEPLLNAERKAYNKALKNLQDLQQKLEHHHSVNEPRYRLWVTTHFEKQMGQLQNLNSRIAEAESLTAMVSEEVMRSGCSYRAAYARILKVKDAQKRVAEFRNLVDKGEALYEDALPEDLVAALREVFKISPGYVTGSGRSKIAKTFEEYIQNFKDGMFARGSFSKQDHRSQSKNFSEDSKEGTESSYESQDDSQFEFNFEELEKMSSKMKASPSNSAEKRREEESKTLYRQLARKLHPDMNPHLSLTEKDLWHEVQRAYQHSNVEQLQKLYDIVENGFVDENGKGIESIRNLSRLKEITDETLRKIKSIQKSLRSVKKSKSWDFDKILQDPVKYNKFRKDLTKTFADQIAFMEFDLRGIEEEINDWARASSKGRKRQRIEPLEDWDLP